MSIDFKLFISLLHGASAGAFLSMSEFWQAILQLLLPGVNVTKYAIVCYTPLGSETYGGINQPGKTVIRMWNEFYSHYEPVFPGAQVPELPNLSPTP